MPQHGFKMDIQKQFEKETGDNIDNCGYLGRYIKWLKKSLEEKTEECITLYKDKEDLIKERNG